MAHLLLKPDELDFNSKNLTWRKWKQNMKLYLDEKGK